jgi:DNA polymerase-1
MSADGLALRIGQPPVVARDLLRAHRETYRKFWRWSDAAEDYALLTGSLHTTFGWTIHVGPNTNPRMLRNFPMQANGAEMMRLACCLTVERGVELCAPIHDALLICTPLDRLDQDVTKTQEAMREASRIVLDGFELAADAKIVIHPDRYSDPRGERVWATVSTLLSEAETEVRAVRAAE